MGEHVGEVVDAREDGKAAGPKRTCAVTRAERAPDELIRFVRGPDGRIVPDLAGRLPGRGVWVTCARGVIEAAGKGGAFARSLRQPVVVPDELADLVDGLLVRRAIEALSLANKAGLVVSGFAKTEAAIASGHADALLHAADAADDGVGKLDRKFRARWSERPDGAEPAIVTVLTSADLSLAIGRPNVVHAALTRGGAGPQFVKAARRLQRYRAAGAPGEEPRGGANTEKA